MLFEAAFSCHQPLPTVSGPLSLASRVMLATQEAPQLTAEGETLGVADAVVVAVGVTPPTKVTVAEPPDVDESHPGPTNEYLNEAPVKVPDTATVKVALPVTSRTMLQLCVGVATAGHGPSAHAVDELLAVVVSKTKSVDGSYKAT
jgi:hypothetical protein